MDWFIFTGNITSSTSWTELPVALPEKNGEMAFTGSVVDLHLADFRDPSVSWDEKQGHWLMAVSLPTEHKVRFYASPNLKQWTQLNEFGPAGDVDGVWECPDLLRIPAEGGKENIWARKIGLNPGAPQGGSGKQYFLGKFDGTRFVASGEPGSRGWTNYGKDDYCAIRFNGLPRDDKPVLIGWMPFAQNGTIAMSNLIFPPSQSSKVVLFPATRKAGSVTGKIWRLRSIWE